MYNLLKELYPICRSLTGKGVLDTFEIIKKNIPLKIYKIPSGKKVFDWEIPNEWNIKDAYVTDSNGKKIIDFKEHNLHIMSYSEPIDRIMTYIELKEHIFTLEKHPNWIPYRTSYYKKNWGFCMKHNDFLKIDKKLGPRKVQPCLKTSILENPLSYAFFNKSFTVSSAN